MKKIITILLLILSWPCFSQDVTVSDPITVRSDDTYDFIGKIKNQYLVFHNKGMEFEIKAFDKDLYSTWDKEIELEKRRSTILGIVPSNDDFSVIYTCRKKRKLNLLLSRFSPAANLLDTATIKIYSSLLTPSLRVIRSEDKTKVLIYHIKEQKKVEVLVYDLETMKILWERKLQPKEMAYYEKYKQFLLSNEGDLFIILQKENRKLQREKHHYEIHQVTADNQYELYTIPMQSNLTYDILFSYDNKNKNLTAAGLYSEKNRGRANGYFFLNIPPSNPDNHTLVFEKFDETIVDNLLGKKADIEKGIADLDVQEIVHRLDGGILMILERNRILERGGGMGNGGGNFNNRSIVDYYFDDVIVFSIHPDGATHWKNVLHKKQYSQGDLAVFSSYFLLKTPSNLRFIFNDEIKPENTVSEYVVKGNGSFERNSVLSTDDQRIQLRFAEALQVGAREFVVPSILRTKMKLIRVTY
ncbi:MAG: hypothetical protein AB8F94_07715 [Saprospiraceae bacterium]